MTVGTDWSRLPGIRLVEDLASRYAAEGFELALVGGAVRDFLAERSGNDLDLVSDATPAQSRALLESWAGAAADVPNPFGVVECVQDGFLVQVATYQQAASDAGSGPPGSRLRRHLSVFDLTINTIAVRLPEASLEDSYEGVRDLRNGLLRTPVDPEITIRRWPPHIFRVARFVAELGFDVSADLLDAMRSGAPALAEADPAECETSLRRLFAGPHRSAAIALLHEVAAPRRLPPPWRERLAAAC